MKKAIAIILSTVLLMGAFSGCTKAGSNDLGKTENGKTKISIRWAPENQPDIAKMLDARAAKFMEENPNIEIVPDQWQYSPDSFLTKASSNQLPTLYGVYLTEPQKIITAGYAADLTPYMDKYNYTNSINPEIKKIISKDGKIYGIPTQSESYAMGLMINMNLMKEAGEINEDGSPKIPQTYEELALTAQRIKQKTGKAGFVLPTMNNCGGWHFMNIAWSYGTEFLKQENGKWKAIFNSDECVKALQYVKDLKWKYDVLPSNAFIDLAEIQKLFATDQAAMFMGAPPQNELVMLYKMNKDNIAVGRLPAGDKGRYALAGGMAYMISPTATDEQIDACFKWAKLSGTTPDLNDETIKSFETFAKNSFDKNYMMGVNSFNVWNNEEWLNKRKEIYDKYTNIDLNMVKEYNEFKDVIVRSEEPVSCQELYKILDACIQAVLTDKDADPKALIEKAAEDFQKNYLDNL
ncbi:MAG: extracellular solute-binding protein [Oscillospiraceae bacterium]